MEYRLIGHAVTEETRVIGGDGLVSPTFAAADDVTEEGELRPDRWWARRDDYCTALWQPPLWRVLDRHGPDGGGWWAPQTAGDAGLAFALDHLDSMVLLPSPATLASADGRLSRPAAHLAGEPGRGGGAPAAGEDDRRGGANGPAPGASQADPWQPEAE